MTYATAPFTPIHPSPSALPRPLQASDVRTALGSGLLQLGLQPKAAVGIYAINSRGEGWGAGSGVWTSPTCDPRRAPTAANTTCVSPTPVTVALPSLDCTSNAHPLLPQARPLKGPPTHIAFAALCPPPPLPFLPTPTLEWLLYDSALHAYSMVSVPLYDTLGPDAVQYICNHAELAAVGCAASVLPTMMTCLPRCPTVRVLVSGSGP